MSAHKGQALGSSSLVELRRALHQNPELRFAEHETAALVAARLREAGLEVTTGHAETGVLARARGRAEGVHVLVRADMDALPTQDLKDVPYASRRSGVAHACGHDVHTTVAVGAAEQLARREGVAGRVTFAFQPAEEIPFGEASGGQAMVDTGVLDDVDVVLGLHCWPSLPAGTIGIDARTAMAAKRAFRIVVTGSGAHAATPSLGRDAVLAASQMVVALHHLHGREIDAGERAAVNVGTVKGGSSQSIVPAAAEITGTIRTVDEDVADRLEAAVMRVVAGVAMAGGVTADVEWKNKMPPVRNDPHLVQRAIDVLARDGEVDVVALDESPMTADDFALYAERRPGLYVKLGVRSPYGDVGAHSLHDGRFDVDERCIPAGVRALVALIDDVLVGNHGLAGASDA
jgi:amidohydrolase